MSSTVSSRNSIDMEKFECRSAKYEVSKHKCQRRCQNRNAETQGNIKISSTFVLRNSNFDLRHSNFTLRNSKFPTALQRYRCTPSAGSSPANQGHRFATGPEEVPAPAHNRSIRPRFQESDSRSRKAYLRRSAEVYRCRLVPHRFQRGSDPETCRKTYGQCV